MLNERQLVWRCRRGVRELDVLLDQFLSKIYTDLSLEDQADFQRLLDEQDPVIMDWLLGRYSAEDAGLDRIIEKLKVLSGI